MFQEKCSSHCYTPFVCFYLIQQTLPDPQVPVLETGQNRRTKHHPWLWAVHSCGSPKKPFPFLLAHRILYRLKWAQLQGMNHDWFEAKVEHYGSQIKSSLPPILVNQVFKFYWNTATLIHDSIIYGYFCTIKKELSSCEKRTIAHKAKNIYCLCLCRKNVWPLV